MFKKLAILGLIAVAALVLGYQHTKNQVDNFVHQRIDIEQTQFITIKSGTSLNRLLATLVDDKWIKDSFTRNYLHRLKPELIGIKAGTYQVNPGESLEEVLVHFISGKEYQFSITFVEGSRFAEWRQTLASAPNLTHITNDLSESEIATKLGIKQSKLEGLFLAETYHYTSGMSDLDILKRANSNLTRVLDKFWNERNEALPLDTAYEALILASIIEKETSIPAERSEIASVFINRLKRGMRLQTDPTVIYGLGDSYDGNIRKRDLKTPTPYNTYVIKGLPPTPIAMVGEGSIEAALNPSTTKYLYFVASGKGGHVFSKSLQEHNRAVRNYLKQLRSNK